MICVAALLAGALAQPASAQLSLTVEDERLVVNDATPGGKVAVLGVVQEFPGDTMHVRAPYLIGEDADREGEISLRHADSMRPIPRHSVFAVVDLSTGRVALGAAEGTRPSEGSGHRAARVIELIPGSTGVVVTARRVSAMLVRPGVGAWRKIVSDGGASDGDGRSNGAVVLVASSFPRVIDTSATPSGFQEGDVVVAINTYTREIHVIEIGESPQPEIGTGK